MRAGSGLTNNSALGKSSPPTGSGMAERSKTSSGAFYLWSDAARSVEERDSRAARRRRLVKLS